MADAVPPPASSAPTAPEGRRRWLVPALILGLFALLWLASIGTVVFAPTGERLLAGLVADPEVLVSDLRTMSADPHVVGRAIYDPKRHLLVLLAKDLPPSVDGRSLVAWSTARDGSGEKNLGPFSLLSGPTPDLLVSDAPPRAEIATVLVSEEADAHAKTPTRDAIRAVATFP